MLAFISWFSVPCRTYSFSSRGPVAHSSDCSQKGYLSYCISVGHVCHPIALWWPQRPQLCDSRWSPLDEVLSWAHSSSERNTVGMVSPGLYLSYHDSFLGVWCLFSFCPVLPSQPLWAHIGSVDCFPHGNGTPRMSSTAQITVWPSVAIWGVLRLLRPWSWSRSEVVGYSVSVRLGAQRRLRLMTPE